MKRPTRKQAGRKRPAFKVAELHDKDCDMTLAEVAVILGVTKARVWKIQNNALRKVAKALSGWSDK